MFRIQVMYISIPFIVRIVMHVDAGLLRLFCLDTHRLSVWRLRYTQAVSVEASIRTGCQCGGFDTHRLSVWRFLAYSTDARVASVHNNKL